MLEITRTDMNQIHLAGRFDASQVEKAEAVLAEITGSCEIDCAKLDYISSAGLGALVAVFHRLATTGDKITLSHVSDHIRDIFRISGLEKLFVFS